MSEHRFHFITGLPRSGSTLFSAILRQNPRFSAEMSGPVYGLLTGIIEKQNPRAEFSHFFTADKRKNVYRGILQNYYADEEKPVVFDTSRAWSGQMPLLANLFPSSKMIACVRDIPWIVDSFERLHQKNFLTPSLMGNYSPHGSVYTRANAWTGPEGIIGFPFDLLKQAYFGEYSDRLLILPYDSLVQNPAVMMAKVHQFLGEPTFDYDFNNLVYRADEFDSLSGVPELHQVRRKVEFQPRSTLLPPDLFQRLHNQFGWLKPGETGALGPKSRSTLLG